MSIFASVLPLCQIILVFPGSFGDPLTFLLAPPADHSISLSSKIFHHLVDQLAKNAVQTFRVVGR